MATEVKVTVTLIFTPIATLFHAQEGKIDEQEEHYYREHGHSTLVLELSIPFDEKQAITYKAERNHFIKGQH